MASRVDARLHQGARGLARLPLDIVALVAGIIESSSTVKEARRTGRSMSLVSREWRRIGQSLVYRHVELSSLEVYDPLVRLFLARDFDLARNVSTLRLIHLTRTLPKTETLESLFRHCSRLDSLVLTMMPRTMSKVLATLPRSNAGQRFHNLTLQYIPTKEVDDFDPRDLELPKQLRSLYSFSIRMPAAFDHFVQTWHSASSYRRSPLDAGHGTVSIDVERIHGADDDLAVSFNLEGATRAATATLLERYGPSLRAVLAPYFDVARSLSFLTVIVRFSQTALAASHLAASLVDLPQLRSLGILTSQPESLEIIPIDGLALDAFLAQIPESMEEIALQVVVDLRDTHRIHLFLKERLYTRLERFSWLTCDDRATSEHEGRVVWSRQSKLVGGDGQPWWCEVSDDEPHGPSTS
ncbi:hypothetical protein JCM10212_002832 [Sporobolomyces blumeae]